MKIGLINPPAPMCPTSILAAPLGLSSLAAIARNDHHDVCGLDLAPSSHEWEGRLRDFISSYAPELIGITSVTSTFPFALDIAKVVKQLSPNTFTVLGGVHLSSTYKTITPRALDSIDLGIVGEAENRFSRLLSCLSSHGDYRSLDGIVYRENNVAIHNEAVPVQQQLEGIPLCDRRIFDGLKYSQAHIMTSRGCLRRCSFCTIGSLFGGEIRIRNTTSIVQEIESIMKISEKMNIFIADDDFLFDPQRVYDLCNELMKRRLFPDWACLSCVRPLEEELLVLMSAAGCKSISFGCESGDPDILRRIGKDYNIDTLKEVVTICRKHNIWTKTSWIVGWPWETSVSLRNTFEAILRIGSNEASIYYLIPYPGTRIRNIIEAELGLILPDDLRRYYPGDQPLIPSQYLTLGELRQSVDKGIERIARQGMIIKAHLDKLTVFK